jgi:hypothetical protein
MLEFNRDKSKRSWRWVSARRLPPRWRRGHFAGTAKADPRWEHHHWHGGHYRAPSPEVYGTPYFVPYSYYAPPPVVYGPGIGLNFTIR